MKKRMAARNDRPTLKDQIEALKPRLNESLVRKARTASQVAKSARTSVGRRCAYSVKNRSLVRLVEQQAVEGVEIDLATREGLLGFRLSASVRLHTSFEWLEEAGLRENALLYEKLGQDD